MSKQQHFAGQQRKARYVVGFIFAARTHVLLCKKLKPLWQKDHWNGIGGKIEDGETPLEAMYREAREEVETLPKHGMNWRQYAKLDTPFAEVWFYFTHADDAIDIPEFNDVGEALDWIDVKTLPQLQTIPNLQYLVPLALHYGSNHGGTSLTGIVRLMEVENA